MDNQIQNQRPTDEIDLLELFNRMGRTILRFFNWVIFLIKSFFLLLIRKSIWIISFTIIGVLFGYLFYSNTPRFYSSQMVARSNSMNNYIIINSINLLNDLFYNKNYSALGTYLGTSLEQAKKIKSIDAYYGIDINKDGVADFVDYDDTYNPKDTTQKRLSDIFYLKIMVYDESVFSSVRDGIKRYISTNPYVEENNTVRKQQAERMIEEIEDEINKLDSFQKIQYFEVPKMQKTGSSQTILFNEKESKLYHNDIIGLYAKKQKLEKELLINPDPITVIQDFTQLSKAENSMVKIVTLWVIFFAILGFVSSLFWEYRLKIWTIIKSNSSL